MKSGKSKFSIPPLSKEEVKNQSGSMLWYIVTNDEDVGPYTDKSILKLLYTHKEIFENTLLKNTPNDTAKPLEDHLSRLENHSNPKEIYLLFNGQKMGPFKAEDVLQRLKKQDLLIGQLVSLDNGISWKKIQDISYFEDHIPKKNGLPHLPQDDTFSHSDNEVSDILSNKKGSNYGRMIDLAKKESERPAIRTGQIENQSDLNWGKYVVAALIILALFVGQWFLSAPVYRPPVVQSPPPMPSRAPASVSAPRPVKIEPKIKKPVLIKRKKLPAVIAPPPPPPPKPEKVPEREPEREPDYPPEENHDDMEPPVEEQEIEDDHSSEDKRPHGFHINPPKPKSRDEEIIDLANEDDNEDLLNNE